MMTASVENAQRVRFSSNGMFPKLAQLVIIPCITQLFCFVRYQDVMSCEAGTIFATANIG